jgi:hypothetical protein
VGSLAILAGGAAGCAAVLARPGAGIADLIPTIAGVGCAIAVLRFLTSGRITDADDRVDGDAEIKGVDRNDRVDGVDRGRRLSLATLGLAFAGVASGVGGTMLTRRAQSVSGDRDAFALPTPTAPPAPPPAGVEPKDVALRSFITPNDEFYRIDEKPRNPRLDRPTGESANNLLPSGTEAGAGGTALSSPARENYDALVLALSDTLSSQKACPGDANLDARVNAADVQNLDEWRTITNGTSTWWDLNRDGYTDDTDRGSLLGLTATSNCALQQGEYR